MSVIARALSRKNYLETSFLPSALARKKVRYTNRFSPPVLFLLLLPSRAVLNRAFDAYNGVLIASFT